ncbi:hypothetical protein [Kribbella endophytica]
MDDELRITVAGVAGLPEPTKKALHEALERRAQETLAEAGRLEAANNSGVNVPMITPTHISDADTYQRRGYGRSKLGKPARNWLLISGMATFVGGHFTNNITKPWGAIGFVICALIAFISFVKGSD